MNGHSDGDGGRSVDISKIPASAISGLKKGKAKAALLHSEDLEDEDNEVWILQCPKNVDLAKLIEGKKLILDPDQPTLLSDDNGQYFESICLPVGNEERGNIATVLPDRDGNIKIVSTKLSGHIMLRESVSELPPPSFNIKPPHSHQLPPGLKHRHPVYGTDFTKILCKMENDTDSDLRKSGKHKKYKRRSEVEALPDTEADADSELCLKSKKHEKRKRMSEIEVLPEIEAESEPCLKKSKKYEKRKRMSETEVLPEIETESEPCLKKRKKHEKRKRMSEIEVLPEIETD